MRSRVEATPLYHPVTCTCSVCEPDAPSVQPIEASFTEMMGWTVVGLLAGGVMTFALDRLSDGPGMLVGFGL